MQLDQNKIVEAVKALDCIPHVILIDKFDFHGFDKRAFYLNNLYINVRIHFRFLK